MARRCESECEAARIWSPMILLTPGLVSVRGLLCTCRPTDQSCFLTSDMCLAAWLGMVRETENQFVVGGGTS